MTKQAATTSIPWQQALASHRLLRISPKYQWVALIIAAGAVYARPWVELWPQLRDTQGALLVIVSIWLMWRARSVIAGIPPVSDPRLLPVVLVLSGAWLLAGRANLLLVNALLWPVLALMIVWAGAGWRVVSKLVFPLGFLYFAIPVWDYLQPVLQSVAATSVGFLLGIAGTLSSTDGTYILLPNATIHIALGCSGTHFLVSNLALGALVGELRDDRLSTRMLILAMAVVLSIFFNALRIITIVLAHMQPHLEQVLDRIGHLAFGWVVLAFGLVVFYLLLLLIPFPNSRPAKQFVPMQARQSFDNSVGFVLAIAAALLLPTVSWAARRLDTYPAGVPAPIGMPNTVGPISPDIRWQPLFHGAAWEHRLAYITTDGRVIDLYRNEYHQQSEGKELFSSESRLFDPDLFELRSSAVVRMDAGRSHWVEATQAEYLDKAGRGWLVIYTYMVDDDSFADANSSRVSAALRGLGGRPVAGILAVATPCVPDCIAVRPDVESVAIQAYDGYESERKGRPSRGNKGVSATSSGG